MKKLFKIMALVAILIGAFFLGHYRGIQAHKYGQIVCDENGNAGTYYSEYNGQIDYYYYEGK